MIAVPGWPGATPPWNHAACVTFSGMTNAPVLSTAAGTIGASTFNAGILMRTGCSLTRSPSEFSVASDVPSPVDVAFGVGLGVGVADADRMGVGRAECVADGARVVGEMSALGAPFFDEPPKPRMIAKATTATTMAVYSGASRLGGLLCVGTRARSPAGQDEGRRPHRH
jgi:hypothetical protein